MFYNNESNLNSCPHTNSVFEGEAENCILDKSAETSIVTENLYNHLILASLPTYEINVDADVLHIAFENQTKRIHKEVIWSVLLVRIYSTCVPSVPTNNRLSFYTAILQ